jgi:hypothetical protein
MKKIVILSIFTLLAFNNLHAEAKNLQNCNYSIKENSLKVGWTAFKTSAKLPVNGDFPKFKLTSAKACSLKELMKSVKVELDKSTVSTQNPIRDNTISKYFFHKLAGNISATVTDISEESKTLKLKLNFNKHEEIIDMTYEVLPDNLYVAKGALNILDFKADGALNSINKECYDLHKGIDGVSKTWPDVEIVISAVVTH